MTEPDSGGLLGSLIRAGNSVLDFFYPPRCPACGAYVEVRGGWCPECLAHICHPQQLPLAAGTRRYIDAAYELAAYRGGLRELIWALTFQHRRSVLPYIATLLATGAGQEPLQGLLAGLAQAQAAAVPVPLHASREKERGYNQTRLIFMDWLATHGIPLYDVLQRLRRTKPMYRLSAVERRQNIKGALGIRPGAEMVRGRHILLVDDIFTTGATLTECARVLHQAGVRSVTVLVLASDHHGETDHYFSGKI